MSKFFDLQATDFSIKITMTIEPLSAGSVQIWLNQQCIHDSDTNQILEVSTNSPLLKPIEIIVKHQGSYVSSLKLDDWEARPQHGEEQLGAWKFNTGGMAFYVWKHHATGQGWLLEP
jgi:hypothetical protein